MLNGNAFLLDPGALTGIAAAAGLVLLLALAFLVLRPPKERTGSEMVQVYSAEDPGEIAVLLEALDEHGIHVFVKEETIGRLLGL